MKKENLINGVRTIMTVGSLAYLGAMIVTEVKDGIEDRRLRKYINSMEDAGVVVEEENSNIIQLSEKRLDEVDL